MSIQAASPAKNSTLMVSRPQKHRLLLRPSPLWACLLLALIVRTWLVIHTHGVIDGDEAMVGIQAQHILRGEIHIYYYAQPYMGSLEAYLMALLFAIAGASVWTLRAEPILLSLLVVWLTWKLAAALAEAACLPLYAQRSFMTLAALFAAVPPLYDGIIELRTLGGYIETFVIILLLLLSALRLTQRWRADAPLREIALRWAGIGFLVGLGFWVDPLVISAVVAVAAWIAGYCTTECAKLWRQTGIERRRSMLSLLTKLSLAGTAIPSSLTGFAPALYWGASNHWTNIFYILDNKSALSSQRLATILHVLQLYRTCIAPRIVGGALPNVHLTATFPRLFTLGLAAGLCYLLATIIPFGLSIFWHLPFLLRIRHLVSLPLLFGACTAFIFCISTISAGSLKAPCAIVDPVGRYASPLLLALPFLFATPFTIIRMSLYGKGTSQFHKRDDTSSSLQPPTLQAPFRPPFAKVMQAGLLAVLLLLLGVQGYTYVQTNVGYTFQTSGCIVAPANSDPIIDYMQHQHIHYAWASLWIGNPIIFKSNGSIITADPRVITIPHLFHSRIPAYTSAVVHAGHSSVLTLIKHSDTHPLLLRKLDAKHIIYHAMRFPSEPGVDLLVVTPLNKPISPFEANSLGAWFGGC